MPFYFSMDKQQNPEHVKRNQSELDCLWAQSIGEDVNPRVPPPARQALVPDQADAAVEARLGKDAATAGVLLGFFFFFLSLACPFGFPAT